jgi:hypothetical protein
MPVPSVHGHDGHRSQRDQKFEPAVRTPTVFKIENTLPLFVCLVDQWQVAVEEVCKLWTIDLSVNNISKVVFKG